VLLGWAVEHVLTRTVRDSAALLDVTAGPAPGDPYPAPPHTGSWLDAAARPIPRLRIATGRRTGTGAMLGPAALAALGDAADLVRSLGHEVVEGDLPPVSPQVGSAIGLMYGALTDWVVRYWRDELGREPRDEELEPLTRALWRSGRKTGAGELLMAHMRLQRYSRQVATAYDDRDDGFDLWLTPTVAGPTPRLGELVITPSHEGTRNASTWIAVPLVVANLTGRAAMSVPLWNDDEGLPLGVHLMGALGGEDVLIGLAAELEQARPWHRAWAPVSAPRTAHDNHRRSNAS